MKKFLLQAWGRLPIPGKLRVWIIHRLVLRFPVGVIGVILNENGELLFFKHTYRGRFAWGLPGGWLKRGEQPVQGIVREIFEETGLGVSVVQPLLAWNDSRYHRIDLLFLCRIENGTFRPSEEVIEMSWFPRDALPLMMKSQYDIIRRIFEILDGETVSEA